MEQKNGGAAKAAKANRKEKPKKSMKQEIFEWVMVFVVAACSTRSSTANT